MSTHQCTDLYRLPYTVEALCLPDLYPCLYSYAMVDVYLASSILLVI